MGFFSAIRSTVTNKLMGELLAEIGTLPVNEQGRALTITIRERTDKSPHLQLKFADTGGADYLELPCTREWTDLLEKTAAQIRKQLGTLPLCPSTSLPSTILGCLHHQK
jgi:hypothetical protein